uniref:Cystatin domain-containing protein n=1 Tax=Brassica campestris TaxID=3711 RepID=A0A3P6APW7_BRACM|nr:unnamed protein product [Brassica rapa]
MNNKAFFFLLLSLVLLPLYAFAVVSVGGWSPISDVKDPHVVEIGVTAGTNYRLMVTVDGSIGVAGAGVSKKYEAIVWEKPWLKSMNLTSFKPTFHVVTVKKECDADCRRRNDTILTHPLNMPANLLYRLWGHETVERWYH